MGERVQRQVPKSNIYHCNLIFHFETPEIIRIILICLPCQHDLGFYLMCKEEKVQESQCHTVENQNMLHRKSSQGDGPGSVVSPSCAQDSCEEGEAL